MKKPKTLFPQKAIISIYIPKDDIWLTGVGTVDAVKTADGRYIFDACLVKDYDKKEGDNSTC